jgi:23S rRNA (adenine2503-C2)-methyltransferase
MNDSDEQASLLARLLNGFRAHVNLITYNPAGPGLSGADYERPSAEGVDRFLGLITRSDLLSYLRRQMQVR